MIRDQLPALSGVAYLNTGTNGPLPRAAADAMREELRLSLEQPRIGRASFERLIAQREAARAAAGRVVGAPAKESPSPGRRRRESGWRRRASTGSRATRS